MKATCPCCGANIELVRDGVLLSHARPNGAIGSGRAGNYCDGSGYTLEQARRWATAQAVAASPIGGAP